MVLLSGSVGYLKAFFGQSSAAAREPPHTPSLVHARRRAPGSQNYVSDSTGSAPGAASTVAGTTAAGKTFKVDPGNAADGILGRSGRPSRRHHGPHTGWSRSKSAIRAPSRTTHWVSRSNSGIRAPSPCGSLLCAPKSAKASPMGVEPMTSRLTAARSDQLS